MAYAFEVIALLAGIVTLVIGYRRNHRNMMLAAAMLMLFCVAGPDLVRGFEAGIAGHMPATAAR